MKYKCLVLDYDDTCVDSTRFIGYPTYVETIGKIRPGHPVLSFEKWMEKVSSHPGILEFYRNELGWSGVEFKFQENIWKRIIASAKVKFFDGIIEVLKEYQKRGGKVIMASHSESATIEKVFAAAGFKPDMIFGWDLEASKRKPNPYSIEYACKTYNIKPSEVLVVDDLLPGAVMAKAGKADFAAACWAHDLPSVREGLKKLGVKIFLKTVKEFREYILKE